MADNALDLNPTSVLEAGEAQEPDEVVDETAEGDPADEETAPEEPAEGETGDEEPAEGDESDPDAEPKGAGKGDDNIDLRKASKELQTALGKFRDADPANKPLAKMLRTALGHDLAYQETFKTPQEAREFKAAVESIGGREALAEMSTQVAFAQETDSMLQANDPKVLDRIQEDFPEALNKLLPSVLERAMKANKESYSQAIQPHLIDNLEAAGVGNVLDALDEAVKNNDTATITKIAANLKAWYGGQKSTAAKFRTDMVNPGQEKVDGEWKKINDEKQKMFDDQWKGPVGQHASSAMWEAGKVYIQKVPIGQQRAYFQTVINEVDRRIAGDKTYMSQEGAILRSKNRDVNKLVALRNAKIDTIVPDVTAKVAKDFGYKAGQAPTKPAAGAKPGAKAPVTGVGSSPQNPVFVKDKPADADRDKTVKNYVEHVIAGRALMKSGPYKGKWVNWRGKPAGN